MSIEAIKMALEVLEQYDDPDLDMHFKAVTALRQAIEEEEKREWVGLTDHEFVAVLNKTGEQTEEMNEFEAVVALWKAIEVKLREKNT